MPFLLSSYNAFQYLINRNFVDQNLFEFCSSHSPQIEAKACKNFNLILHLSTQRSLLLKQEPHGQEGQTHGDLSREWRFHQLLRTDPELDALRSLLSEPIDFDSQHSILICDYLTDYGDLDDFYSNGTFPPPIATALGLTLAKVHRATFNRRDYQRFLAEDEAGAAVSEDEEQAEEVPDLSRDLQRITPDVLGEVSTEGLKFYELYQRYESLGQTIADLNRAYEPCCLIHNDLKFNNILLHLDWQTLLPFSSLEAEQNCKVSMIRLIDWEKWLWGDPAADLGALIASYLKQWLKSLVIQSGIEIPLALKLAGVPLERLQPSIVALTQAYLSHFPDILVHFPDFLSRVIQFTGLALIESIQAKLYYREPFGNIEICMLQVAKSLLGKPEQSISTVFGITATQLLNGQEPLPSQTWMQIPAPTKFRADPVSQPSTQHSTDLPSRTSQPSGIPQPFASSPPLAVLPPEALLQDLINQIQIQNGWLCHPDYPVLEPPEGLSERLQALPLTLRRQYFKTQWRNFLYDLYFSGELALAPENADLNTTGFSETASPALENNAVRGLNLQFYQQIHQRNNGKGYWDQGWQVVRLESDGTLAVQKQGLTLHVTPADHLPREAPSPCIGEWVAIRLPAHRMDGDFYVAVGNAGPVPETYPKLELCFNILPDAAIGLMQEFTQSLNAMHIPFSFRLLVNPDQYRRYDTGVLHLARAHYQTMRQQLQPLYQAYRPQFHRPVPLFMKPLAPGLGLAEEPSADLKDFGLQRCQLVAEALMMVWEAGTDSPEARLQAIGQQFAQQGLDLQHPYLNPGHEDDFAGLKLN